MNLYSVTYKFFQEERSVQVVAKTPEAALEGARFVQRQRHGYDAHEILSMAKVQSVDRVQK